MVKKPIVGGDPKKAEASLTLKHIAEKIKKDGDPKKPDPSNSGKSSRES